MKLGNSAIGRTILCHALAGTALDSALSLSTLVAFFCLTSDSPWPPQQAPDRLPPKEAQRFNSPLKQLKVPYTAKKTSGGKKLHVLPTDDFSARTKAVSLSWAARIAGPPG